MVVSFSPSFYLFLVAVFLVCSRAYREADRRIWSQIRDEKFAAAVAATLPSALQKKEDKKARGSDTGVSCRRTRAWCVL